MLTLYMISRGHCTKSWRRNPAELLNTKVYLNLSGEVHKLQILSKSAYQEVSLEACIPRHLLVATTGNRRQDETQCSTSYVLLPSVVELSCWLFGTASLVK